MGADGPLMKMADCNTKSLARFRGQGLRPADVGSIKVNMRVKIANM